MADISYTIRIAFTNIGIEVKTDFLREVGNAVINFFKDMGIMVFMRKNTDTISKTLTFDLKTTDQVEIRKQICFQMRENLRIPFVCFDRDGVINRNRDDYVKNMDELKIYNFSYAAIKLLNIYGIPNFVISNQSVVAKGLITGMDLYKIDEYMHYKFAKEKVCLGKSYYCTHLVSENCSCRKPNTKFIDCIKEHFPVGSESDFIVGDYLSDIEAGNKADLKTILVKTGRSDHLLNKKVAPDYNCGDIHEATKLIVQELKNSKGE